MTTSLTTPATKIEKTKISINREKTKKDERTELQEELKGERIFMTKGIKTVDTNEEAHNLGDRFKNQLAVIDTIYSNNEKWKNIFQYSSEIMQNIARYSSEEKPIIFEIKEDKEGDQYMCKIETLNYFKDEDGTKTKALKKKLDEVNEHSRDEVREKYKKVLDQGSLHEKGGAGLGFLDIGRTLKKFTDKPFTYSFQKDKDGSIRFKLLINVPLETSLVSIKEEHKAKTLKEIDRLRSLQITVEDGLVNDKNNNELKQQHEEIKTQISNLQAIL